MITIRGATAADWERIFVLLTTAKLPTEDLGASKLDNFLVAQQVGGEQRDIVGLIGLQQYSELGLLRSLVVADSCHGKGIGTRLLQQLETIAADGGVRELWLLTIDADRYFSKHGFLIEERAAVPDAIQRTEEFSNLCPGDATLMRKML